MEILADHQRLFPCLGKGSRPGGLVELSSSMRSPSMAKVGSSAVCEIVALSMTVAYLALCVQLRAISVLRRRGGEEAAANGRHNILKRVHENRADCAEGKESPVVKGKPVTVM